MFVNSRQRSGHSSIYMRAASPPVYLSSACYPKPSHSFSKFQHQLTKSSFPVLPMPPGFGTNASFTLLNNPCFFFPPSPPLPPPPSPSPSWRSSPSSILLSYPALCAGPEASFLASASCLSGVHGRFSAGIDISIALVRERAPLVGGLV
jgi:hypothetical protein